MPAAASAEELVLTYTGRAAKTEGEVFDPSWSNIEARTRRIALPSGAKVALLHKTSRGEEVQLHLTLKFGELNGWW